MNSDIVFRRLQIAYMEIQTYYGGDHKYTTAATHLQPVCFGPPRSMLSKLDAHPPGQLDLLSGTRKREVGVLQ